MIDTKHIEEIIINSDPINGVVDFGYIVHKNTFQIAALDKTDFVWYAAKYNLEAFESEKELIDKICEDIGSYDFASYADQIAKRRFFRHPDKDILDTVRVCGNRTAQEFVKILKPDTENVE